MEVSSNNVIDKNDLSGIKSLFFKDINTLSDQKYLKSGNVFNEKILEFIKSEGFKFDFSDKQVLYYEKIFDDRFIIQIKPDTIHILKNNQASVDHRLSAYYFKFSSYDNDFVKTYNEMVDCLFSKY